VAKPIPGKKARYSKTIKEHLALFEKATNARYRIALAAYEAQDAKTKEAIDAIRDRLTTIASATIRIFPDGKRNPGVTVTYSHHLVDQNILYMATEIVKDLAFMDIRVENYEFPKVYCNECSEKITPKKKKRIK
jgi:hypothetical protein